MAIFIEEEKKESGRWFGFAVLFVVLIIIGVAVYYLFFVKPELFDVVIPVKLQSIDQLTKIVNFEPKSVLEGDFYKNLRQVIPPPSPPPAGNATPFNVF
jgi:hypothetical protein